MIESPPNEQNPFLNIRGAYLYTVYELFYKSNSKSKFCKYSWSTEAFLQCPGFCPPPLYKSTNSLN